MKSGIILLLITVITVHAIAQNRYTISGTIKDHRSGEPVIHASVTVVGKDMGTVSNQYGFYSITLPERGYILVFSAVGMQPFNDTIRLCRDMTLDITLDPSDASELKEVVVSAYDKDNKLQGTQMGADRLSMATIRNIPVFLGETDILKTIQLLPGVSSAGEGNTGFYVRGGAPDQNLILLDGTTVYNPSHLLGLFSTFNADAIKDVSVYKGAMPPQFGGRLSSIEDVRMNEGNNQSFRGRGGEGLLTISGELEGPIQKGQSSFIVAARGTKLNQILSSSDDTTINRDRIGFYDLNAKFNFRLGRRDQLYGAGYLGQDNLSIFKTFGLKWGNGVASLRWNHVVGSKLFANTTVAVSNYNTEITAYVSNSSFNVKSALVDYSFRQDWEWYTSTAHTARFGIQYIDHVIAPAKLVALPGSGLNDSSFESRYGWESCLYAGDDWKATGRLTLSYGVRLTGFTVLGPGRFYHLDSAGNVTDTLHYGRDRAVKHYINPEPRLALGYQLDHRSTVKAAYARNVQNVHLLANSALSVPTDRWMLTNNNIEPEIADQFSLGYYRESGSGDYSWNVETYYKMMQHQIDYRTGANLLLTDIVESEILFGKGRSYGMEVQVKKTTGRLTGWISYTYSRSQLQIAGINNGQWYNAIADRTHNAAIVAIYQPDPGWTLSADWVYYTGTPVSYPSGKYIADGRIAFYYSERNGYRLPVYHRLDLGAVRHFPKKKWYQAELAFGVYNAYDRLNAYFINFRQDPHNAAETQAVQTSLFGIVPYFTLAAKF
jgi:hypothetical protein